MEKIIADWKNLRIHAGDNAEYFFERAVNYIDSIFGEGYAKNHPELIGSQTQSAAVQHQALILGKCIQDVAESLNNIDESLADISNKLNDIETAIGDID